MAKEKGKTSSKHGSGKDDKRKELWVEISQSSKSY